ncbi:glycosyltransferase family 2 protein [Runella sp.]|uniref:glycosyltransferase family 2 protein n=1 Tax=Runella sp. TaxID=1960881 RepID=UPI003D127462
MILPISIIIPVYNAEKYVHEALQSVINQSIPAAEIIVINDGSTDRTLEIIKNHEADIYFRNNKNQGLSATLNEGIQCSTQPYIAFLDADDVWAPHKLETQWQHFQQTPDIEISFGLVEQFISPELPEEIKAGIYCPSQSMRGFMKGTMLVRRTVFETAGLFDQSAILGDFIDWFARAQEKKILFECLNEVLLYRRLHRESLSGRHQHRKDFPRLLKKALDRRRQEL